MKQTILALVCVLALTVSASTTAVHSFQVTIGAGTNTRVWATDLYAKQAVFQNNDAADMRVGGSEVTSSVGMKLYAATHGSVSVLPMNAYPQALNLKEWFVAGTNGQVLDVTYVQ